MAVTAVSRASRAAGTIAAWLHSFAKKAPQGWVQAEGEAVATPLSADSLKDFGGGSGGGGQEGVRSAVIDVIKARTRGRA